MPFCSSCGADVESGVKFCPSCGAVSDGSVAGPAASAQSSGGATTAAPASSAVPNENLMGAVAYVTIIPAILFLVMDPYKNNSFIRFHSFQCLFFAVAAFVLSIVFGIVVSIIAMIPVVGWLFAAMSPLISLAILAVWAFIVYKAYSGERYKLPVIGDYAEKQAAAG